MRGAAVSNDRPTMSDRLALWPQVELPLGIQAYGCPPADNPGEMFPWFPGDAAEVPFPAAPARIPPALPVMPTELAEALERVAAALSALRLAPEIAREDHRATLDLCAGEVRRVAAKLGGGR